MTRGLIPALLFLIATLVGLVSPEAAAQQPAELPSTTRRPLAVVVLDPAHGGADTGARGSTGIVESEVTLSFARLIRVSLESAGLRVILTRQSDQTVGWEERSRPANAQRGAVFISVHVASTGPEGTVRVYSLSESSVSDDNSAASASVSAGGLIRWDRAQQSYLPMSRKLAALVQTQMAQRFRGSPAVPAAAAVRQLQSVAAPAVAIEVSSVSLADRAALEKMGPALAEGVARAIAGFGPVLDQRAAMDQGER